MSGGRKGGGKGARIVVLVGVLLCAADRSAAAESAPAGAPVIVASIFPLAAIAAEVAGPEVRVVTLLTPGANPHTFEPTPSQVWAAAGAALVVRIGLGFDDWVVPVVHSAGRRPLEVLAGKGVDLLPLEEPQHGEHGQGGAGESVWDPHLWMDPLLAADIGRRIGFTLGEADPDRSAFYRERAGQFEARMERLDRALRALLGRHTGSAFVATHAGWAYFARRYRLRQVAVLEPAPGRSPGPRYLLAVADKARSTGARAVFAEVQLGQGEARIIAEEAGIPVIVLDPLGGANVEGRGSYPDLLLWNARRIAAAFEAAT